MKEDIPTKISKKIRNQLIYYTYLDLKNKPKDKNCLLINSMTQNELNDKYQKCSDYCVEKTETYTSSQMNNGIDNNNYFHVSVTYCSLNNNYHILIDNKNVDQYLGQNNIVGKYYKGNKVQIGTTTDKIKYHINLNQNKLEKKIIGEKKLIRQRKSNFSSLEIIKNIKIIDENTNNINEHIDNLKSNNNELNHKKLINNNEKVQTNCGNKIRKTNTQKTLNKFMIKLKKYCQTLIHLDKRVNLQNGSQKTNKDNNTNKDIELSTFINDNKKRKNKNDKNYFRSGKEKPKFEDPPPILHPNENINNQNNSIQINSKFVPDNTRNFPCHKKLKSQTRIMHNLYKIKVKNSFKKHRSIDNFEEESISPKKQSPKKIFLPKKGCSTPRKINYPKNINSPKKVNSPKKINSPRKIGSSPRKVASPRKFPSPKKVNSPKKTNIIELNSGGLPTSKFFNVYQKFNKKERLNDSIKKYVSGNKVDIRHNKRKANIFNSNATCKVNNNEKINSNLFRGINNNNNNKNITKKGKFKKSLTINKMYKFKAGELLEKKINNVWTKDNNKH